MSYSKNADLGGAIIPLRAQALPAEVPPAMGDWVLGAACAVADPEIFFPATGKTDVKAKAVCARCRVRRDCLEYSLATGQPWGVWGGLNEAERRSLARRRRQHQARATTGGAA